MTAPVGSAARLRRARAVMTLLFTATTALCLGLLVALAVQIDGTSRAGQLGSDVTERAGGLARAIYFDAGQLHLEPLSDDELAQGATGVGVFRVDADGRPTARVFAEGHHPASIAAAAVAGLVHRSVSSQATVHGVVSSGDGPIMWAVSPVWNGDAIGAVVVAGQSMGDANAAHTRLAVGLILGCVALLGVAAGAGFLLAGRAMKPAADALEQQERFLTEAAHELRTPLTTLRLLVEAGHPDSGAPTLRAVDRLSRLVDGLWTRARMEAGTFEPERTRLRLDQLVERVVEDLRLDQAIGLEAEPTVTIGDPALLQQALRNLIENAVHHGGGTPVTVSVAPTRVRVRDEGPGIPAHRLDDVVRSGVGFGAGTGTGLAIVSWVAHLHGGTLELGEAPGGGLDAELRLPCA